MLTSKKIKKNISAMADVLSLLEEDFTCPICCDVFRNPVALKCSHSICEQCLQQYWSTQEVLLCPVCRKQCSSEEPTKNLAFTSLCVNFKSQRCVAPKADNCPEHDEKLKLFCFEDKQPVCVVCYTSKKHENHKFSPIVEAVQGLKETILEQVERLKVNLDDLNKVQKTYEEQAEKIMNERLCVEDLIKMEFEKLHQFLKKEEESRIKVLRKREKQKTEQIQAKLDKLSKDITSLSETIAFGWQEMEADDITFLKRYNETLKRLSRPSEAKKDSGNKREETQRKETQREETNPIQSLLFTVWARMQNLVTTAPVKLDPNTASSKLVVSEDLSSILYVEKKLTLPNNPERLYAGVLGSQGFSSGLHCWDVGVADSDHWTIGVVKQSAERKKLAKMEPSKGFWCIRYNDGKYWACLRSLLKIKVKDQPWIIRVQLDYEKGQIKFYDPFRNKILHFFANIPFNETVFPYFCTGRSIQTLDLYAANELS